jgi:hypothetical protein
MQLCFVSVHGPRETYIVDEPRSTYYTTQLWHCIEYTIFNSFRLRANKN